MDKRHHYRAFEPALIAPVLSACPSPRRFLVAASGGLDSSVLVHAVASLRPALAPARVRVVHVDHGLHPSAATWTAHCAAQAHALGLPFSVRRVEVQPAPGASLEAAARDARYAALAAELERDEILLTAHHADDQLETVLLALMRGAGVAGLAAMPAGAAFGSGSHLRPLLALTRAALERYARAEHIFYCEDPSNRDVRFARNYLRREIVPRLVQRWPAGAATAGRSAALCAEASELADELATLDLAASERDGRLDVQALVRCSPARARNTLRAWIRRAGFGVPSRSQLERVLRDAVHARRDAQPCVAWPGVEVRRYRDWLHVMAPLPERCTGTIPLRLDGAVALGTLGVISLEPCAGPGLSAAALAQASLSVSFRRGGERIRPCGHEHRRELKKLFQEHDIVPWMRGAIPLLHAGAQLAAVADLWMESELVACAGTLAYRVRWHGHPALR